jgi:hypothetical protein
MPFTEILFQGGIRRKSNNADYVPGVFQDAS